MVNYEQAEKLGGAAFVTLGDEKRTGAYRFGFSAFTNDRKNFDNSWPNDRISSVKNEAASGDTRSLESYVGSLDISFDFGRPVFDQENSLYKERLSYHFAYLKLAVKSDNAPNPAARADQTGYTLGLQYLKPLSANYALDGFLEFVNMRNSGGVASVDDSYLMGTLALKIYNHYSVNFGFLERKNFGSINYPRGFDQNFYEASVGYSFGKLGLLDNLVVQFGGKITATDYKAYVERDRGYGGTIRCFKEF
jgi:hypothetical protein